MSINSNISVQLLKDLSDQELERAVELHVQAYSGDEYIKCIIGNDWSLLPIHGRSVFRAALSEGLVYAVRVQEPRNETIAGTEGKIVSLGIFFRPGTGLFATKAQRELGFHEWFDKLSQESQTWHNITAPEHRKNVVEPMYTDEERSKRWWCSSLVTDLDYQGKGYAKMLIKTMFEKISEEGGFLGLATLAPINVAKYKAMGFTVRAKYNLPTVYGELELTSLVMGGSK
ncbi:hypothetical protein AAF712_012633 [Marasmius tenuissimus]|uniref:N-acetyltransferase domain-containing protein n=1 Tax=Marasmius tenuissimus TaxID=585030 RepID=A0ABR2ZH82_9AGAR